MQWEVDRLSAEVNAFARLPSIIKNLDETYDGCESASAMNSNDYDIASDTTGEYDENDEDLTEAAKESAPPAPLQSTKDHHLACSPTAVAHDGR